MAFDRTQLVFHPAYGLCLRDFILSGGQLHIPEQHKLFPLYALYCGLNFNLRLTADPNVRYHIQLIRDIITRAGFIERSALQHHEAPPIRY